MGVEFAVRRACPISGQARSSAGGYGDSARGFAAGRRRLSDEAQVWVDRDFAGRAAKPYQNRATARRHRTGADTGGGAAPVAGAEPFTRTFTYIGGEQTYTVPAGVSFVHVLAVGGHGANAGSVTGGVQRRWAAA
jgi:hypothetical protein